LWETAPPLFSGRESYNRSAIAGFVHSKFTHTTFPLFSGGAPGMLFTVAGFVYLKFAQVIAPPPRCTQGVLPSLLCVLSVPCLLFSFFFSQEGSDCPGGYAGLSQGWL
jgi:hypothetical protein